MAKKPKQPDASAFDLGEGAASAAPTELAALHKCIAEAVELDEVVTQMEEDLDAAKKALHAMRTVRLPELMTSLLQSDDTTWNGHRIQIQDKVNGSLPKDPTKREKALQWLNANEGGGLIKTELKIEFSKTEHNAALALADDLRLKGYEPVVASDVNHMSLGAFARERLADGKSIDLETIGLHSIKIAKITKVKEK